MHIHLDLVGGLSGDMFIAAMLDCFPKLAESLPAVLVDGGFKDLVKLDFGPHSDGTLTGTRVVVVPAIDAEGHDHRHYADIVRTIEQSALTAGTRERALAIFKHLAAAEARIHGTEISRVAFHEIGAWDSIADIVCAAYLIDSVSASSWSVSSIPLGRGRIQTAHGLLPVPAPATTLLLEGFRCHDDGVEGERVTPTGAAILKHLAPIQDQRGSTGTLRHSGHGFGTKVFAGLPNMVRAMVFADPVNDDWQADRVIALAFEVDDQTPESLSQALDRLRATEGVLDVTQSTVFGKKGRQMMSVRILADIAAERTVVRACFSETTTLGIRRDRAERLILRREHRTVRYDSDEWRVKISYRPAGDVTAKLEQDDAQRLTGTHQQRLAKRRAIETEAIRQANDDA